MEQESREILTADDTSASLKAEITALMAGGISQARIARESGVSVAAVSQWLRGIYPGDASQIETRLSKWVSAHHRKAASAAVLPPPLPWVATATGKKIMTTLQYAHMASDMAVIYGGAGVGKTMTLRHYAEKNPNVWVVELHAAASSVAAALDEISEVTGVRLSSPRAVRVHRELTRKFKNSGGLLCIDEAQHLQSRTLEAIRAIHDQAGIGLVLCGNESVYARLTGGSRDATFAQLFSRLGKRCKVSKPLKEDVSALVSAFGADGVETMLEALAQKPGGLRSVVKALRLASMLAAGAGEAMSDRHLKAAIQDLEG